MALPPGARLLHIGPHKTGTTTLQAALHQNRSELLAQGVHCASERSQPLRAVMAAALGRTLVTSNLETDLEHWRSLVEVVNTSDARAVVLSSEFFADAPAERIPSIVADLGPDLLHVAITVVVLDEADKRFLLRSFEELLDLTEDTLEVRDAGVNRSLTLPEVEMLRAFNAHYRAAGWSHVDYTHFVRLGAARHLGARTPGPDEARILTPPWAVDRSIAIGQEIADGIRSSGVNVLGDLDLLAAPPPPSGVGDNPDEVRVPVDAVASFVAGMVHRVAEVPAKNAPRRRTVGEIEAALRAGKQQRRRAVVQEQSSRELLRVVGGRLRRRLRRAARRPRTD